MDNKGTPEDDAAIKKVVTAILKRRPTVGSDHDWQDRALSDETYRELMEVVEPTDANNPFSDPRTAERSMLSVHMLAELGVRRGELLGIRVSDIDWEGRKISIHRRADDPHDPRMDQPRTKTLARELPLSEELLNRLRRYVMGARRRTRGANRHPILLVAHKKGGNEGNALSISGLNKTFETLRNGNEQLVEVHAHGLRHYWNWWFSQHVDARREGRRLTEAEEIQIRDHQMGWVPGSKSAKRYNRRHIVKKAQEAALSLQGSLSGTRSAKTEGKVGEGRNE